MIRAGFLTSLFVVAVGVHVSFAQSESAWLAGRYDRTRVIVYFQAVKFNNTFPKTAREIAPPVASAFFKPKAVDALALAKFQQEKGAEHFAIGDRYELLLGNGRSAAIRLTQLVAFESDEFVGNDSYIGALAAVATNDVRFLNGDYFAVRRFSSARRKNSFKLSSVEPSSGVKESALSLIRERMASGVGVPPAIQEEIRQVKPSAVVWQSLAKSDSSSLRHHVFLELHLKEDCLAGSAWLSGKPLRITAFEEPICELHGLDTIVPRILNVVDLTDAKVGLVVEFLGGDGRRLELLGYVEGAGFNEMPKLQTISVGE